jgi:hypothetical protein
MAEKAPEMEKADDSGRMEWTEKDEVLLEISDR